MFATLSLILPESKSHPMSYELSFELSMCSYLHNFIQVSPLEFLTLFPSYLNHVSFKGSNGPLSPRTQNGSVTVLHLEATPPSKGILLGHAPDKGHLDRELYFFSVLGL